jgi:hypothetical protein
MIPRGGTCMRYAWSVTRPSRERPLQPFVWLALLIFVAYLLAGCSNIYDKYGQYEGSLSCKGKGSLTGNGSLSIGAGYGGSGTNAWTVQGDCGEGFSIERHRERSPVDPPAK